MWFMLHLGRLYMKFGFDLGVQFSVVNKFIDAVEATDFEAVKG